MDFLIYLKQQCKSARIVGHYQVGMDLQPNQGKTMPLYAVLMQMKDGTIITLPLPSSFTAILSD